jgi:hypothetical protein
MGSRSNRCDSFLRGWAKEDVLYSKQRILDSFPIFPDFLMKSVEPVLQVAELYAKW